MSLRLKNGQKLLFHHLPASSEICSEKPHKNNPQQSKQEGLGELLTEGYASTH